MLFIPKPCIPICIALVLGAMTSSCVYEYPCCCISDTGFTIVNDWTDCPDAHPEGMAYLFFPDDGSPVWRFDFPGMEAGVVSMPEGNYKVISYNDDTSTILFDDKGGYDGYKAYCCDGDILGRSVSQRYDGGAVPQANASEPVKQCPDMMWGVAYCGFGLQYDYLCYLPEGEPGENSYDAPWTVSENMEIVMRQRPLVARYECRIEDVKNLGGVSRMCAAMSGMAGSLDIPSGRRGPDAVTLPFAVASSGVSTISGNFHTFGIPSGSEARNMLNLFVWLADGRRFNYEFDVSDQVRNAPDSMDVLIVVRGLTIEPSEEVGGGGFDVGVDDWETIVINIQG